jgi:hypothetical protein
MSANPILRAIGDHIHAILSPLGFKREKLIWRKSVPELIQVVGFDKSSYSNSYRLIYGLALSKDEKAKPMLHDLSVSWPYNVYMSKETWHNLRTALNLECSEAQEWRKKSIDESFHQFVLPTFDATSTIEHLKTILITPKHPYRTPYVKFKVSEL